MSDRPLTKQKDSRWGLPIYGCTALNAIKGGHERSASNGVCSLCGDGPGAPDHLASNEQSVSRLRSIGQSAAGCLTTENGVVWHPANELLWAAAEIERLTRERAAWESTAAEFLRNQQYYCGLVDRVGRAIGQEAYTADDGSTSEDVLRAKVPEIIERRLSVRPSAVEMGVSGWRPIETAPIDGREILTLRDAVVSRCTVAFWSDIGDVHGWAICGTNIRLLKVTHWMPLPGSPEETNSKPLFPPDEPWPSSLGEQCPQCWGQIERRCQLTQGHEPPCYFCVPSHAIRTDISLDPLPENGKA